jgi:hypothetical protein
VRTWMISATHLAYGTGAGHGFIAQVGGWRRVGGVFAEYTAQLPAEDRRGGAEGGGGVADGAGFRSRTSRRSISATIGVFT